MDQQLIADKLESLRRCVHRIESRRPATIEELKSDWDIQDIVSVNLTRAVQISVDIASHLIAEGNEPAPNTMAESFDRLKDMDVIDDVLAKRMKSAVGFRNIAVHTYEVINWKIVFSIIQNRLIDFQDFARGVHAYVFRGDSI